MAVRSFGSDRPPPLTELFAPPQDHIGTFGWMCGYSADAAFMNDATERFTLRSRRRRALEGEIALALILDQGNPRLSTAEVPGVLHLAVPASPPFLLLHAKVALLGFRHLHKDRAWRLRLIVSSGNWTRQTLEESLDLGWRAEVGSDELRLEQAAAALTDIAAGANFMAWLRDLSSPFPSEAGTPATAESREKLDAWCRLAAGSGSPSARPRFIDSRSQPLLTQIVDRIVPGRRNYLAMGSGFFEGGGGNSLPRVPDEIVRALKAKGAQNPDTEVDLFVNPDGCQAIASARNAIAQAGWKVRRAGKGPFGNSYRSLHAKFLFGAQYHGSSDQCLRAWIYLGSGNLTHPGLLRGGSARPAGNLEAGVVLAPEGLAWKESAGSNAVPVGKVLPIDWSDGTEIPPEEELHKGGDMPERPLGYFAPPISYLRWMAISAGGGRLQAPPGADERFDVLDPQGTGCARDEAGFVWAGDCPPEAVVRWAEGGTMRRELVCVIDHYGRVAASRLGPVGLDEVWSLLAEFPLPPAEDDHDPDDPGEVAIEPIAIQPIGGSGADRRAGGPPGHYPVRRVMELVERVAARQTELNESDWTAWCVRLEQTLDQVKADPEITAFRALGLDPLSALKAPPFRPLFAETGVTDAGRLYELALGRVATAWGVAGLQPLED